VDVADGNVLLDEVAVDLDMLDALMLNGLMER
jgi:hypothetical protein